MTQSLSASEAGAQLSVLTGGSSLGYVSKYGPCSVCDKVFDSRDALIEKIVPLYGYSNNLRITGWDCRVLQCMSCREKYGEPVRVYHRPYEFDVVQFEKCSDLVVLNGGAANKQIN